MTDRIDPGPVIVDGRLRYTSATQLSKASECLAKWGFEYISKIKPPQTKGQLTGISFHGQQEHYLTTGEDVRSPMVRAAARFTPKPMSVSVEVPLHRITPDGELRSAVLAAGLPVVGYIDVFNAGPTYLDSQGDERPLDGAVEIKDWKSTSDLKYATPGPKLLDTIQMPAYGMFGTVVAPGRDIRLTHVNILTSGAPNATLATTLVRPEMIRHRWSAIELVAARLKEAAKESDPNSLEKNPTACRSYGGCPHLSYCRQSPAQIISRISGGRNDMSLANLLPASMQPTPPASPGVGVQIDPAAAFLAALPAAAPAAPHPLIRALDTIKSYGRGWPALGGDAAAEYAKINGLPVAQGYAGAGELSGLTLVSTAMAEQVVVGLAGSWGPAPVTAAAPAPVAPPTPALLPPDSPPSNPAAAFVPAPTPPPVAVAAPAPAPVPASTPPAQPPVAAEPKRRGRPPGSGTKKSAVTSASPDAIDVYVDCVSPNEALTPLGPTISAIAATLAEGNAAPDIRCSDAPALSHAKWKGALAAMVRAAVADGKIPPGAYYLDARSEFGAIAADALEEHVVARGVR